MKLAAQWILLTLVLSSCEASGAASSEGIGVCEQHMATAAASEHVPLGVLYAVGLTETGRKGTLHPFALNIEGRTVFSRSAAAALKEFARARKEGAKLIDLGCMQINHHYHGSAFPSVASMLEPAANVSYAARFLRQLREREGSWTMAVARYHAGPNNNPAQKRYICAVIRNLVATGFGGWTPASRKFCH